MSGAIPLLSPYDCMAWRTIFPLYLYFNFMPKKSVSGTSQTYRRCTTSCPVALMLITQTKNHIFNILDNICGNYCLVEYDAV
jgi:hypothetical protein